jgi:ATP-dependent protease ClpP protease subunit
MDDSKSTNRLVLFEEVSLNVVQNLIASIREMKLRGVVDATLEINSVGGSLVSALNLYDNLVGSGIRWTGIVIGECLSSAAVVLQGCEKREALPNASFFIHVSRRKFVINELRTDIPLQVYQDRLAKAYEGSKEIEDRSNKILRSRLKSERLSFDKFFTEEQHFSSLIALEMGLIDEIVTTV